MEVTSFFKHLLLVAIVFYNIADHGCSHAVEENGSNMIFSEYQRLDKIYEYLDHLAAKHPNISSVGAIGNTAEDKSIKYIKISNEKPGAKVFFIEAGIEARDWISVSSAIYIIKQLLENWNELPELSSLEFNIVPVLNPDGYEYSFIPDHRMWRKNRSVNKDKKDCQGVELDRNFDIDFSSKPDNPCRENYPGVGPNSELETQALTKFLENLKKRSQIKAYISFRNNGPDISFPFEEKEELSPNYFNLYRLAVDVVESIWKVNEEFYGISTDNYQLNSGGSDGWVKKAIGADYVYRVKLGLGSHENLIVKAKEIVPIGKHAFEAVKTIGAAASKA